MRTVWYMRGSVSLEEIYQVGPEDREIMSKLTLSTSFDN